MFVVAGPVEDICAAAAIDGGGGGKLVVAFPFRPAWWNLGFSRFRLLALFVPIVVIVAFFLEPHDYGQCPVTPRHVELPRQIQVVVLHEIILCRRNARSSLRSC